MIIYSIGHSTRSADEFISLLKHYGIQALADVRSFPGSRKFPHFNKEDLDRLLSDNNIMYVWIRELGGLRRLKKGFDSSNTGLVSPGFRAYADHMAEESFAHAANRLLDIAAARVTAIMCAEAVYWRCHRRLLSDFLLAQGVEVRHIFDMKTVRTHVLSHGAVITDRKQVIYPA
ncbi:MAG: DUF488 domain-containing protein [Desulfomonile sp.]|nr:DUF488 domain-containing protein [Desulfomonile sp.]